jgi:hypothetical protein
MEKGKKHPLLAYRVRYRRHRWLYFGVALAVLALYAGLNLLPADTWKNVPWVHDIDWLLLPVALVILAIAIFRAIAGSIPYVQCSERNIKVQAPLYQVVFSYKRVQETRPNSLAHAFEHANLSRRERQLVFDPKYSGYTAIIVDMNSWPMSLRSLRFWLGKLLFGSKKSLVLWVEDWMTLNRELSDYKDRWRARQQQARSGTPSGNLYTQVVKAPKGRASKKKKR